MMYEKYFHIYAKNGEKSIEEAYSSMNDLRYKFTVRGDGYRVYNNHEDYFCDMEHEDPIFHEVIFDVPQKLKFDIDAKNLEEFEIPTVDPRAEQYTSAIESSPESDHNRIKFHHIVNYIYTLIRTVFFSVYSTELSKADTVVCESVDPAGIKFSMHIIITRYFVANSAQAREFTKKVYSLLPQMYRTYLDVSVNKSVQNFRIVNNHKGDGRFKRIITQGHVPADTLITNTRGCAALPDIVRAPIMEEIPTPYAAQVLQLCDSIRDHTFKLQRGSLFTFVRKYASMCDLCGRVHDRDNTLFVTVHDEAGHVRVMRHCRKYTAEHGGGAVLLGEFMSDTTVPADNPEFIATRLSRALERAPVEITTKFHELPDSRKTVYVEPQMRPYEVQATLVVHAMMKMGKSKGLLDLDREHFSGAGVRKVILSFRQTFSSEIKDKFPDFTLYSDVKGPLKQERIIVQVESLHRLAIDVGIEPPDLLVMDECESIFDQFGSGLLRNSVECFSKFQYLIRFSKHVVCMDANISDRTYNLLEMFRPGTIYYHRNEYRNSAADIYYMTSDKFGWLQALYSAIDADERIACPMASLAEAKVLYRNIVKSYPAKRVKLYSSETKMSEKKEHFGNVNLYWREYDILIYTPTISAGVSFEEAHFDKVFAYFTDQSCSVETSAQMIGRIRNVASHQLYVCLSTTGNNLPTEIEDIKAHIYNKRDNLLRNFDDSGLVAEYGPYGEIKYHESDYFYLWLENTRIINLSRNYFMNRFIDLVRSTGAQALNLDEAPQGSNNFDIRAMHGEVRRDIMSENCRNIARAQILTQAEVAEIHEAIADQRDIDEEKWHAFNKYNLVMDYNFTGSVDEKFVERYYSRKIREMYRNLVRINSYPTAEIALEHIQRDEYLHNRYIMELDEKFHQLDLNRKYVFDRHRYAISLIKLCGWSGIYDERYLNVATIKSNLDNSVYRDVINGACAEFEMRAPRLQPDITNMLKPINKIIGIMYGIAIIYEGNDNTMYRIKPNGLFALDPEDAQLENIPCLRA